MRNVENVKRKNEIAKGKKLKKKKRKKHLPGISLIEKRQSPESISQKVEEKSLKSNEKGTG